MCMRGKRPAHKPLSRLAAYFPGLTTWSSNAPSPFLRCRSLAAPCYMRTIVPANTASRRDVGLLHQLFGQLCVTPGHGSGFSQKAACPPARRLAFMRRELRPNATILTCRNERPAGTAVCKPGSDDDASFDNLACSGQWTPPSWKQST